jgi:hypothetical protein
VTQILQVIKAIRLEFRMVLTLPASAHIPVITTVTTMPRHAVSDIDRHIKYQIRPCQELQDLEAALTILHPE